VLLKDHEDLDTVRTFQENKAWPEKESLRIYSKLNMGVLRRAPKVIA